MDLRIRAILLYPRDHSKPPRRIEFKLDQVNVLTGESQTGKSALLAIVDYCLGSGKCAIPVGKIREKTEWFGVLFQMKKSQLFLARKEPGTRSQTSDMCMREDETVDTDTYPAKTANVDAVTNRLNQLAGLPTLEMEPDRESPGFAGRPSFRDMAAFTFQPQHIIANPYTVFFKADTYEHQEKLKYVFPFVLGAVDNDHLALKRELSDLEKELERKTRELDARRRALDTWAAQIRAFYSQGRELGLLSKAPDPQEGWRLEDYLKHLRTIRMDRTEEPAARLDTGATARAAKELSALREEEDLVARGIGEHRMRLTRLEELASSSGQLETTIGFQQERLRPAEWFREKVSTDAMCPICGHQNGKAVEQVARLVSIAQEIDRTSAQMGNAKQVLTKEIADTKKRLLELERSVEVVRAQRKELEGKTERTRAHRQQTTELFRFLGRLEQALENVQAAHQFGELSESIRALQDKVTQIRSRIDPGAERKRLEDAQRRVTALIARYLPTLDVESPDDPVFLDLKNLTLKISSKGGREDFLWEIGSGANWMGYHVATLLALQEHFISLGSSPVPTFLMVDQPSQVYFPEGWPGDPGAPQAADAVSQAEHSDDIQGVHKFFETVSAAVKRMSGRLQIIVIDHADQITWKGLQGINRVGRWRDGDALIPKDW